MIAYGVDTLLMQSALAGGIKLLRRDCDELTEKRVTP